MSCRHLFFFRHLPHQCLPNFRCWHRHHHPRLHHPRKECQSQRQRDPLRLEIVRLGDPSRHPLHHHPHLHHLLHLDPDWGRRFHRHLQILPYRPHPDPLGPPDLPLLQHEVFLHHRAVQHSPQFQRCSAPPPPALGRPCWDIVQVPSSWCPRSRSGCNRSRQKS